MNKKNIDVLTDLIVYSQQIQSRLVIIKHEGMEIDDINVITDEEQNKLDEAVEILKKSSRQMKNIMLNHINESR